MSVIDYEDLMEMAEYLDIRGDYTYLEGILSDMTDSKLVSMFIKMKKNTSAVNALRGVDIISRFIEYEVSDDVLKFLSKDLDVCKWINDGRVKSTPTIEKLQEYISTMRKKDMMPKKDEITYTYHGFDFGMKDKSELKILFSKPRYARLKRAARERDKGTLSRILSKYKIKIEDIETTTPYSVTITKFEKDAIVNSIKSGIIGAKAYDFLGQINYANAVISEEELKRGISEENIDKIFGEPDKKVEPKPIEEVKEPKKENNKKYKTTIRYDEEKGAIKDLGTQKLFVGEPVNICSIFNIKSLCDYITDIPENEYIRYDFETGKITPVKIGELQITVQDIHNNQVKTILLSVNPTIRHLVNQHVSKKKEYILKNDSQ